MNKKNNTTNAGGMFLFICFNFFVALCIYVITLSFIEPSNFLTSLIGLMMLGVVGKFSYNSIDKLNGGNKKYYRKYYKILRSGVYILELLMIFAIIVGFINYREIRHLILGIPVSLISTFLVMRILKKLKEGE